MHGHSIYMMEIKRKHLPAILPILNLTLPKNILGVVGITGCYLALVAEVKLWLLCLPAMKQVFDHVQLATAPALLGFAIEIDSNRFNSCPTVQVYLQSTNHVLLSTTVVLIHSINKQ